MLLASRLTRIKSIRYLKDLKKSKYNIWIFPVILFIFVCALSALRISGSSIGVYAQLDGTHTNDANIITDNPRGVRSDEWLVNTQMIVAQDSNDYKRINENIGLSQDMSVIVDAPYKEWSALFEPQNFAFFILPLEFAFAFKWWILSYLLIIACYFLILELFPKKILRAVLIALFVGLSPMIFWWYQSITLLPLAYSFLIILLAIRLLKSSMRKFKLVYSIMMAYVLTCFGLILYPPFQIPCIIVIAVFLIGYLLDNYDKRKRLEKLKSLLPYIALIITFVCLASALYYVGREATIQTIRQTAYPGTRVITSGGPTPLLSFSSFLSPNLQYDQKAASGYFSNQSEASNFIFIAPYLFIPSIYLIIRQRKMTKKLPWGLILINVLLACFLARMYIFTPSWLEYFYRIFLLDKVPNSRLQLGTGLAGILQIVLIMNLLEKSRIRSREIKLVATFGGVTALIAMVFIGVYTINHYPIFIQSIFKVLLFSAWIAAGIFFLLYKKYTIALLLLVGFSALSVYKVHPLYRGLGPITDSSLIQTIKAYPDDGSWITLDDRLYINFPLMAGKDSLNTIYMYPQLELWGEIDKDHDDKFIYNRFAHVLFSTDASIVNPMELKHADLFVVKFEPCGEFASKKITYVLSVKALPNKCMEFQEKVITPGKVFYIYKISPKSSLEVENYKNE